MPSRQVALLLRRVAAVAASVVLLVSGVDAAVPPASAGGKCSGDPGLVGRCWRVQGRLSAYNGNPTFRIWPIGSARLLGLSESRPAGREAVYPDALKPLVGFERDVLADYLVCPFTREEPGVMQLVCVEEARDVRVRPRAPVK